jgi:hypothetical protein
MRTYSREAMAAIEAGETIGVGALKVSTPQGVARFWGGYGELMIDGEPYAGVGDRSLVNASGGSLGTAAQATTITLSGVDPDTLSLVPLDTARNAPAVLYRLTFDGSGRKPLSAQVHLRGRCSTLSREDTPGGAAKLVLTILGPAAGLGRALSRRRTDADQRLITGADSGMKHISYAGNVTLALGGKPAAKASVALPNTTTPGGYSPEVQAYIDRNIRFD